MILSVVLVCCFAFMLCSCSLACWLGYTVWFLRLGLVGGLWRIGLGFGFACGLVWFVLFSL